MNFLYKYVNLLCIIAVVLTLLSCEAEKPRTSDNIYEFVAPNPALIVKVQDYAKLKFKIDSQALLKQNSSSILAKALNFENWEEIVDIPNKSLIAYYPLSRNEMAETLVFKTQDSLPVKIEASAKNDYDGEDVFTIQSSTSSFFYTSFAGYTLMSTSKIILENIIRNYKNEITIPASLSKLTSVLSDNTSSVIINTPALQKISNQVFSNLNFLPFKQMTDYIAFDLIIDENDIFLSGIVIQSEEKSMPWTNFSKVKPSNSVLAELIPNSFLTAKSVSISGYTDLFGLEEKVNQNLKYDSLWFGVKEVGNINLTNSSALVIVGANIDETNAYLNKRSVPLKSFGSFEIYKLTEQLNHDENIAKYIDDQEFEYYSIIKDMVLASKTLQTLEDIIIEINNNNILALQPSFASHLENLNSNNHIVWYTNLEKTNTILEHTITENYKKDFAKINWSNHELLMTQMRVEDGFAYVNILQRKRKPESSYSKVEQVVRMTSDEEIITKPQFFKNWRTGQYDIVYQDSKQVLHLRDTKGNLIWSKALDSPILGDFTTIDIYQNKRLQLAFATQDKIYVVDKNGKDVSPFPIQSKAEITQGLSVFDYDNNGKYRFIMVNDDKVKMYDKTGKKVKGFKYKKAKSSIKFPIKHMRTGGKDYILVQDDNGGFEILDRRGKSRVKLNKNFTHTGGEWFVHKSKFVSLSDAGKLVFVDTKGGTDVKTYDWINPKFVADSKSLVSMSENKLSIDKNVVKLPYGLYSSPMLTSKHVALADRQDQKIYVFDKTAKPLQGFPVYGKDILEMYYTSNALILLVLDEKDAVIVYKASLN